MKLESMLEQDNWRENVSWQGIYETRLRFRDSGPQTEAVQYGCFFLSFL